MSIAMLYTKITDFLAAVISLVSTVYYYPYFGRLFSFKLGNSKKVP